MATGTSAGEVYIELGLDISQLESDFINADQTIQQNLNRLNRERNLIELRAQVEIGGLDESADAERILATRQRSLNQQMEIQRDRIALVEAAYRQLTQTRGRDSAEAQRMEQRLQRERLSLQRLEQQLRQMTQAENEQGSNGNDFGGLNNLADSVLDKIPPQAKAAATAIAGIGTAIVAASVASKDLVEKWRELQTQAYELNMSVNDTENFLREMRLAGGDIGDFEGYIRGISDAYVKGEWDDPEFITLRRYNAEIVDTTGKLKDFKELTEEVYQAWKKADAEGNGIEFLQMTGGESGVRDAIQYFKRYEEAKEDAKKVFDAGLDPEEMHQAERQLNLLSEQMDEFKDAAVNIITPFEVELAEGLFDAFHTGTEWLVEAKEALEDFGKTDEEIAKAHSEREKLINKNSDTKKTGSDIDPLSQYGFQRANDLKDEIADLRIAIDYENEYQKAIAQANLERERNLRQLHVSAEERAAIEEKYRVDIEMAEKEHADRMDELWQETASLQYEATHSAFEKEIRDIEIWKNSALDALGEYQDALGDKNKWIEESAAILANAAAKEAQAVTKEIDRIKGKFQSLEEKIFELTHSQEEIDTMKLQKEIAEYEKEGIYSPERLLEYAKLAQKKINGKTYWDKDYLSEIQGGVNFNLADYGLKNPSLTEPILNDIKGLQITEFQTSIEIAGDSAGIFADSLQLAANRVNDFDINLPSVDSLGDYFNQMKENIRTASNIDQRITNAPKDTKSQPAQITINVPTTNNINLGGAYVFDNALKNQLTTDITNNVASAVTSAVNQAATQIQRLGYNN